MVRTALFAAIGALLVASACEAAVKCTEQGRVDRAYFRGEFFDSKELPLAFDSSGYVIQTTNSSQLFTLIGCSNDYQYIPKVRQHLQGGPTAQGFYKIVVGNVTPSAVSSKKQCLTVNLHGISGFKANALIKQPCDLKEGPGQETQTFNKIVDDVSEIFQDKARFVGSRTLLRGSGGGQGYNPVFKPGGQGVGSRVFYPLSNSQAFSQGIAIGPPNYCDGNYDDCDNCDCD